MPTKEIYRKTVKRKAPKASDNNGKRLRYELKLADFHTVPSKYVGDMLRLTVIQAFYFYEPGEEDPAKLHAVRWDGCLIMRDTQGKIWFRPARARGFPVCVVTPQMADDIIAMIPMYWMEKIGRGILQRIEIDEGGPKEAIMELEVSG